jgi:hypothetical protein
MALDPDRVRVVSLDSLEGIPVDDGGLQWLPVRRTLDVRAFGVNAYRAEAT